MCVQNLSCFSYICPCAWVSPGTRHHQRQTSRPPQSRKHNSHLNKELRITLLRVKSHTALTQQHNTVVNPQYNCFRTLNTVTFTRSLIVNEWLNWQAEMGLNERACQCFHGKADHVVDGWRWRKSTFSGVLLASGWVTALCFLAPLTI